MLENCADLEYLKTPAGLKTSISNVNHDFKMVKLKKGNPAIVENESQNLNSEYEINKSDDNEAVYHIYRKDKYAGVIFDKNGKGVEGVVRVNGLKMNKFLEFSLKALDKSDDKSVEYNDSHAFTLGAPKLMTKVKVKTVKKGRKR